MVSHKIGRKKKQSRRIHKYRRNNTKKKYRKKNKTRKIHRFKVMKGGSLEDEVGLLMAHYEQKKIAAFDDNGVFFDPYYKSEIIQEENEPPFILVSDNQRNAPEDKGNEYLSHYDLMLIENIIDIIHDVVAEGSLSYDAKLSLELIIKSYTAIYNYPEYNGWRLILLGLLDSNLLEGVTRDQEQLIRNEQNREQPEPDIQPLKDIFDTWIQKKAGSLSKSTGAGIELTFKNYLYKKNKNKYVIDPTYQKRGAIQMAVLQDWDYANGSGKSLQVTPYGGGSLRNGIRLWEYILGRGNSYLDLDPRFTWVENTIEFPNTDDVAKYRIDKNYAINFDNIPIVEKNSDKANHFLRYMLFYLYVFIRDIDTDDTISVANKSSQKNTLYALYERIIATEEGERAYDEDPSVLYNLHINFTDAGDKPSSAVSKLYETMRYRESVYGTNSSKYPVENKSVSNLVDKATSTVGPEVSIKTFGDGRRPICDSRKYRDQFNEEILYDDILTENFIVVQNCTDKIKGGPPAELTIKQELVSDENIFHSKQFLELFLPRYTGLLNDIRVLYHNYIKSSNRRPRPNQMLVQQEITTKDLIKLKFFHLMNYMVFLAFNEHEKQEIIDLERLLTSIKGGIKKDFSESQCGQELEKGLKGWLKPFFSVSKPDNFQLKDHWDTWDGIIESKFFKKEAQQGIIPVEPKNMYNPKKRPSENKPEAFQSWSNKPSKEAEMTNGELYDDYKRDKVAVKLESIRKIRSSPFYKIYKNVVASEELYNIAEKTFEDERQQSFIASTTFDKGQKKYFQWSKVNQGNVIKEYLSTAVVFNNLDNSIDVYNGWRVANLSACDVSNNRREFDFENEDKQYVNNILSLKGVCIIVKNDSEAAYKVDEGFEKWSVLQHQGWGKKNSFKLLLRQSSNPEIYRLFILINRYEFNEETRRMIGFYNGVVPVYNGGNLVNGTKEQMISFIKNNFLKRTNSKPDEDDIGKNTPDFFSITNFFKSGVLFPKKDKLEDYEYNLRFSDIAQRIKTTDDSGQEIYIASEKSADFWQNIGILDNKIIKVEIKKMINEIPNLFALLYNFILYDFDTPDTNPFPSYTGSRTTGKIVQVNDSIDTHRHLKGDTFIQRGIKEAIQNLESMIKNKKGIQTINCRRGDFNISFTSDNPSVTGVLTNVREYMIHYLLVNNGLPLKTAKKIKPTFFRLDSRQNVEDKNTQALVNEILRLFMYGGGGHTLSGKVKQSLAVNITNKIRDLSTNPNHKYIIIGLLLNHKTQGDEMQLHSVKALKELFPIDNDGLEVLYHCYSFDGVMGIKALRKGASLLFQSGRGVQISLASKTTEIAWKRLQKPFPNPTEMKQDSSNELREMTAALLSEMTYIDVKDPIQRTNIDNNDPSINIKTWYQDNIAILFRDLTVSRIEDVSPSQLEINEVYQNLLDAYLNSIDCNFDILSRIKFEPFKNEDGSIIVETNKQWYKNMDASFNDICSTIKTGIEIESSEERREFFTIVEQKLVDFSEFFSSRYNLNDTDLEEILKNIDSFQRSLLFFNSNMTSISENMNIGAATREEQEFFYQNTGSFLLSSLMASYLDFILQYKDNEESKESVKNHLKLIKVCLKFMMISITKEQINLQTEVIQNLKPGQQLTRGLSEQFVGSQDTSPPRKPPTRRTRVGSTDAAGVSPVKATIIGDTYPIVNFGEYLKLRIKKVEELANYMSSEINKLDTCKSLLENASKVPTLLGEGKSTQKYLLKDKTSTQSQIFVNKFMKKLDDNMKEAGILKNALGRVVDRGSSGFFSSSSSSSSNDMISITRAQYIEYLALKRMSSSDGAQSDGAQSDGAQGTLSPMKPPKKKTRRE